MDRFGISIQPPKQAGEQQGMMKAKGDFRKKDRERESSKKRGGLGSLGVLADLLCATAPKDLEHGDGGGQGGGGEAREEREASMDALFIEYRPEVGAEAGAFILEGRGGGGGGAWWGGGGGLRWRYTGGDGGEDTRQLKEDDGGGGG